MKQLDCNAVTVTQRHGSLVETLHEFEKGASLIVVGKRGEHADFAKGHLGSTTTTLLRTCLVPVLLFR